MPEFINKRPHITWFDPEHENFVPINRTIPIPYATEDEVLDFANRLRTFGGADAIDAFFPSYPGAAEACLIATALNFGCNVRPEGSRTRSGEFAFWTMNFPPNMPIEKVAEIAEAMDCKLHSPWSIVLPRLIGNAASAFDEASALEDHWVNKYRAKPVEW